MEAELGRKPDQLEFFGRIHKRQRGAGDWCDPRAKKVAEQYRANVIEKRLTPSDLVEDEGSSSQVSLDPEAWAGAVGGPKKNYVYGFRLTQNAENILGPTVCSKFTSGGRRNSTFHSCTPEEEEARFDAKVEEKVNALLASLLEKVRAEMEEAMDQRFREFLANIQLSTLQRPNPSTGSS